MAVYKHLLQIDFISQEFKKDDEKRCTEIEPDSLKDEVESLLGMKPEGDDMSANLQSIECALMLSLYTGINSQFGMQIVTEILKSY